MMMLILIGASFLSVGVGYLGIPMKLAKLITSWELSPYVVLFWVGLLYLLLGCFFDGISMMVMTVPIFMPTFKEFGFEPLWLGVYLVILIEIAQITPPVGFNLYIIQSITPLQIDEIVKYTIPFFLLLLLGVVLIVIWPSIALWVPKTM
jgi:TRAP-type C4-dicarboxylate transport system permease large subunit